MKQEIGTWRNGKLGLENNQVFNHSPGTKLKHFYLSPCLKLWRLKLAQFNFAFDMDSIKLIVNCELLDAH